MTLPKAKFSLESFGPHIPALLRLAMDRKVEIELPTTTKARALQTRIHTYRARLRDANDPFALIAQRVKCSVLWGERTGPMKDPKMTAKLVLMPRDSEFTQYIEAAGVKLEKLEPSEEEEAKETEDLAFPPKTEKSLDDVLELIWREKKKVRRQRFPSVKAFWVQAPSPRKKKRHLTMGGSSKRINSLKNKYWKTRCTS